MAKRRVCCDLHETEFCVLDQLTCCNFPFENEEYGEDYIFHSMFGGHIPGIAQKDQSYV